MKDKLKNIILWTFTIGCIFYGCERNLTGPENIKEKVVIQANKDGIEINNNSSSAIAYMAINKESLALINWAPICADDNTISAGQKLQIPNKELWDYKSGAEFMIYWWSCPRNQNDSSNIFSKQIFVQ